MIVFSNSKEKHVSLIGHPFATVGMGEQLRSHIAACRAVHLQFGVMDIFRYAPRTDYDHRHLLETSEVEVPPAGIRIFHINGDEVEPVIEEFGTRGGDFADGYNVVVPAWELPTYPEPWAQQLRRFDEVWALSRFISVALASVDISSTHIGQAVELPIGPMLPRRYFGIRESAFVLLHFLDLTSYASRKNPEAVLRMFAKLRQNHPFGDIQLVLKVKKGDEDGDEWLQPIRERLPEAICLSRPLTSYETKSLINCCDCFVSLHRAEGFGRGTGEAMFLGRLALATGWSGNLDYMTEQNSLLARYNLIPIGENEYPYGEGQVWADADVDHAVELLDGVLHNPHQARSIAARGRRDVRLGHSFRAVGTRVLRRVEDIFADTARKATVKVTNSRRRNVPEKV